MTQSGHRPAFHSAGAKIFSPLSQDTADGTKCASMVGRMSAATVGATLLRSLRSCAGCQCVEARTAQLPSLRFQAINNTVGVWHELVAVAHHICGAAFRSVGGLGRSGLCTAPQRPLSFPIVSNFEQSRLSRTDKILLAI